MVRDFLIKAMTFFGTSAVPMAIMDAAHDKRVHDARGIAQLAQAELERATRLSRRSIHGEGSPEGIERRVAELDHARMQIENIVKSHDDPDADLLRGMDRS